MIVDAHKKEIRKFDTNRALSAWDSLVSQQQLKLQKLKVPTMHITSESPAREVCPFFNQMLFFFLPYSSSAPAPTACFTGVDQYHRTFY